MPVKVYIKSSNKKSDKGLCEFTTRDRRYYHREMKRIAKNEKKKEKWWKEWNAYKRKSWPFFTTLGDDPCFKKKSS